MKKLKKIIICSIVSLILCFVGIFGINADSTQDESNHNFSSNWIAEDFVPNNVIPSNLNGVYEYQINPNFATWFNSLDETVKDTYFPRKHQINYGEQNIKFFGFGSNVLPDDISNPYSLLSLCDVVSPTNEYYLYQSPFMIEENIHDYNSSDYLINKVRFDIVTVNEYGDFEDITLLYYDFNSKEMSYDLNAVALLDYKLVVPSNSNLYEINYFMLGLVNGFNDQIINSLNNSYFLMNQLFIPVNETETKYTVSFDLNGATGTPPSSYQVVAMGNAITPTEPTRNGYVFKGWLKNTPVVIEGVAPEKTIDHLVISSDTIFYALWEAQTRVVTFDYNYDDIGTYKTINVGYGECPTLPLNPIRTGYTFKGWSISSNSSELVDVVNTRIYADRTYYAVWQINQFNVSFDLNGAEGTPPSSYQVDANGNAITPTEPIREGYVFKGWLKNTPVVIEGVAPEKTIEHLVITTDTIFYALWEAQTRIVEFDLNGGIGEVPQNQIVSYGGSITTPSVVPTKEGYNFIGWSVYKNWSNESDVLQDLSNEVIYSDRTYYACWSKIPNYEFSYLSEDQIYYYEDLEWQTLDKNIFDLKVYDVNNELINGTCTWEHKIPFNSAQDDDFVLNDYNNIIVTFVPENNNYNSFSFEIEFLVYETKTIVIEFKVKLKVGINQYNEILLKTKEYNREYKLSNDEIKDFINSHMTFDYQIISIENHNTPILTMPKTIIINVTYNTKFVYFLNYGKPYSDYTEEVNMKWETSDFTIDYLENSLLYKPVYLLNPIRNGYIFKGWKNAEGEIVNGGMIESSSPISYYFLYAMWEKEPSNYLDQIDTENVVDKKYPNVSEANYIEIDNLNLLLSYIGDEGKITILPNYKDSFVLAFQKPNGYKKYLIKFDKTFDFLIGKEIIESYYEVENNEILINYYLENNIMLIHNLNNGDYVSNNYITLSSRDFGFIDDDTEKLRSYYIYFNSDIPVDKFLEMEFNLKYHFIVNSLFKDRVTDPIEVNFTYNDVATQVLTKGGWWIFNNYKDYAFTDYLVENVFEEGSYVVNNTVYKYRMLLMHEDYEIDTWKYFVLSPLTLGLFQNYLKTSPDDELVVDYLDPIKCSYILNGTEYKDVQVWDKIDIGTEEDNDGKAEDLTPDVVPETKYGPFSFKGFILDLIELVKNFSWLGLLNLVKNYWGVIGIIIGVPIAAMFFKPLAVVLKLVINIVSLPFKLLKLIFGGRK